MLGYNERNGETTIVLIRGYSDINAMYVGAAEY